MEHFIDIIIPEYNCSVKFMKELLQSISRQKNVDFEEIGIIIVNDNSKNKYKNSWFKQNFPKLDIAYYKKDINEGTGMTRQYGLNQSKSKYVTFVDQDDELYGNDSLIQVINFLKTTHLDCICTHFVEEVMSLNGKIVEKLCNENEGRQTLHGVFIKRRFLLDNNICFQPGFRVHDDYFIRACINLYDKPTHLNVVSYLWKYNQDSQVRSKNKKYSYIVETYDEYFNVLKKVNEYRDKNDILHTYGIIDNILSLYCILESNLFDFKDLQEKKDYYEKELFMLISKYNEAIEMDKNSIPSAFSAQINAIKSSYPEMKMIDENETLFSFIQRMKEKYPNISYVSMEHQKLLDIIVPIGRRNDRSIETLINSIIGQKNISLREISLVFVDNSYEEKIDFSNINKLVPSLDISYYKLEGKMNLAKIKQYGIDNSNSKYITFINTDDMFYGPMSFKDIFSVLRSNEYELIFTSYYEFDPNKNYRNLVEFNNYTMYGTFFSRSAMQREKITYNTEIEKFEDEYFLTISKNLNSTFMNIPMYVRFIDFNSIYNIDSAAISDLQNYANEFINSNILAIEYLKKNGKLEFKYYVSKIYEIYYIINSIFFTNIDTSKFKSVILENYQKNRNIYKELKTIEKEEIKNSILKKLSLKYKISNIEMDFDLFFSEEK